MKNKPYAVLVPKGVQTLLVKKSHATSVFMCKRRNFRQGVSVA
jgi:hypothetical protein